MIGAVGDDGPGEAAKGQVKVRLRILGFILKAMERHYMVLRGRMI